MDTTNNLVFVSPTSDALDSKERYPRAVWSRFRQLMRQPKAQRCRRDMTVCAMLLSVSRAGPLTASRAV